MIATLFDWPWDDRHRLPVWSDWTAKIDIGPDPVLNAERETHIFEMAAAFKQLFEERKAMTPKGDLLSIMAHSEVMGYGRTPLHRCDRVAARGGQRYGAQFDVRLGPTIEQISR